nr:ribosomal protein S3 [Ophiostoma piliferum]
MEKDIKLNKNKINIFNKYINNKYKLVVPKTRINYEGLPAYYPSEYREWYNNIYYYNFDYIKNLPVYNLHLNKLLKNYFDLYLILKKKNKDNIIKKNNKRFSLNKIFISKAELKYTSSKLIITIYIFNRERLVLIKNLIRLYYLHVRTQLYLEKNIFIYECFKGILNKKLKNFNRIKFIFNINNLKFKDIMLFKLSKLLNRFYKKKVEFNIINLNSYRYNSDIFTEIFKKKAIKRDVRLLNLMEFITKKNLNPKSLIIEDPSSRQRLSKFIDYNLIHNKYRNFNISDIIKNISFNETLKNIYYINNEINDDFIYKYIKYKLVGGIRLEIRGRLSKRSRADRSKSYLKIKGTLQNVDSSFKGLYSKLYRNKFNSNTQYTIDVYKRHIGAYAVKGWIAGMC